MFCSFCSYSSCFFISLTKEASRGITDSILFSHVFASFSQICFLAALLVFPRGRFYHVLQGSFAVSTSFHTMS